jgi:hypothetical protein
VVTRSTLNGNDAGGQLGTGGGIANGGTLTVTNSTISGNSAFESGGGIDNGGTLTFTDSTISRNSSGSNFFNPIGSGDGISNSGTAMAAMSIFANAGGGNLDVTSGAQFVSLGHNLFSDTPRVALDPTDLINTDPLLGPLDDNGGPTLTHALLPGSPALDAGVPVAGVTTDQRGISRPQGGAPDIGAFESRGFSIAIVNGDSQQTPAGLAFPSPLVLHVASPFGEPVTGGRVTFAAPTSGASAVLSANSASIDANGQAAVTATANGNFGVYTVTARTAGAGAGDVSLTLINLELPSVTGAISTTRSRERLITIVLGFNEALDPASAVNGASYSLALGVKKKHRLVFRKSVKIGGVTYDGTAHTVTLRLSKPAKGPVQLTVRGGIKAANGASSRGDFTTVVKYVGSALPTVFGARFRPGWSAQRTLPPCQSIAKVIPAGSKDSGSTSHSRHIEPLMSARSAMG